MVLPSAPAQALASDLEFRRAIEEIKARTSLEELVGEVVDGGLVAKSGRLWACCPFHDESTPSFAIGPDPGLWYCFGACNSGGDLIEFVKRRHNIEFRDAIELLASRAGVELPRSRGRGERGQDDAGLRVLAQAEQLYRDELLTRRGAETRAYLERRGLGRDVLEAFGIGLAPAGGQALVQLAKQQGGSLKVWQGTGLIRVGDSGRPYDFFRGRLMIPIRDHRGRTLGFGGRRLSDDVEAGPKYVNTPETDWFKKGTVIYGYDRAVDTIRRGGHAILMEGYTDVIAAHQAGLRQACAVLGTATTRQHAALLRRSGLRRVTLVFDGDEAGRRAAWRALEGLLPLDVELDVVRPPAGQDPADLLADGDAQPFLAHLELAQPWFDFVRAPLAELRGRELSKAVDEVLELLSAVPKPVLRDSLLAELAQGLGLPADTLRDQWRALPERRRVRAQERAQGPEEPQAGPGDAAEPPPRPVGKRIKKAYMEAVGAALVDSSLIPRIQPLVRVCPVEDLRVLLEALCTLWDDEDAELGVESVMNLLAEHPVRSKLAWLVNYAQQAESPVSLLDGALEVLARDAYESRLARAKALVAELEREQAATEAPEEVAFSGSSDPEDHHPSESQGETPAASATDSGPATAVAQARPSLSQALEQLARLIREGPGTSFPGPPSPGGAP